jgi:hypothetical protein
MSYLLFTSKYTRELINLGYHDAGQRIEEIESYLFSSDDGAGNYGSAGLTAVGKARRSVRPRG